MKWYEKIPVGVISVLLSIGLGVLLYTLGISTAGVAILSALGLEVVIVVHRILVRAERADPIRGMIQAAEIDGALTKSREILRSGNRPARFLVEQALSSFIDRVNQVESSGVPLSPQEFMGFAQEMLDSARKGDQLRATSILAGGTYWSRAYGKQYEAVNRRASESGLSIERLYLLKDEAHLDKVSAILERQAEFSNVRIALLDGLEAHDDNVNLRHDFFVFNEIVSAEFVFAEPNAQITHILVSTNTKKVRDLGLEYDRIRDLTTPYKTSVADGVH